jgi:putative MFS transporter
VDRQQDSWKSLFRGRLLRRTTLAMAIMVCMNIAVYAVTAWVPTILMQHGFRMTSTLGITTVMQIGSLPGALLGAWVIDRWGRKLGLISVSCLAAVMAMVYAFTNTAATLAMYGFILFVLLYALAAMTFGTYVPEIFPTRLRLTGCGISNSTGRLANVVAPFGIAILLTRFGSRAVYYAAALILVFQALSVLILGEETRGRSLEEIQYLADSGSAGKIVSNLHS